MPQAKNCKTHTTKLLQEWCPGAELNHRHEDFQSTALPTELPGRFPRVYLLQENLENIQHCVGQINEK